ncbi:hypothetical protein SDC9_142993 [bioreactor metagenome]|uniref:Uncharacterized protein n=1 Tax=bioreactor metagenome TaxID=1076179 RepID=A0A645E370_9ZZZZ
MACAEDRAGQGGVLDASCEPVLRFEGIGERGDHPGVVEDAGAFADAVHRPHRRADVDAGDAQAGGDDRADRAAAAEVATVGVLLAGNAGAFADGEEAGGAGGVGGVALVGVALDHRAAVDQHAVAGFVGGGEVRMPAVRHVGADEVAGGEHPPPVFVVEAEGAGKAGEHVAEEAAAGAGLPAVRHTDAAAHGQERRVLVLLALPGLQGHAADRVPDGPAQRTAQAARCLQGVLILAFPLPRRPLHWRRGKRPAPRGTPKRASPSATVCAPRLPGIGRRGEKVIAPRIAPAAIPLIGVPCLGHEGLPDALPPREP